MFLVAVDSASRAVVGLQDVSPFADFTRAFDHVGVIGTYVDLRLRRQGIAAQLFAATFDAARRKGYEKIFTYVRADNDAGAQDLPEAGVSRGWHRRASREDRRPVHRRNRDREAFIAFD